MVVVEVEVGTRCEGSGDEDMLALWRWSELVWLFAESGRRVCPSP